MLKNSIFALLTVGLCSAALIKKNPNPVSGIYGQVKDKASGDKISFVNISLYRNDSLISSTHSSNDGSYAFKNVAVGRYKIKAVFVGYTPKTVNSISYVGKPIKVDVLLAAVNSPKLEEVVRIDKDLKATYKVKEDAKRYAAPMGISYAEGESLASSYYRQTAEFNTEEYRKIDDNEFKPTEKNPLSTFSIDVDKASYSNVRRFITQGHLPPADAVRVEEMVNYFSYNYPQPKGNDPFSINTQYITCPWNSRHSLVHIGIQGLEVKADHMPSNNLVFLLDVSGSMASADKLPLLKSGLRLLVDQLRPQDRVAIVVYAGAAGVVLPPTTGTQKEIILAALDNLQAGGSTAGGEGILLAYNTARAHFMKEGNNRVILATDGDFNVGTSSDGELVRLIEKQREDGIFLTVLGFGTGNYKDSKMEQLADKGNGNYAYIDNIMEAKKTLVKEMGGTLLTIAKDVKIQVEFNPAKVKAYRLVGYENRVLNNEDFNDDRKDAGELGSGHTVTAIYEIIPANSNELLATVDSLRYQKNGYTSRSMGNELMTIKFRYKQPTDSNSKLITGVVYDKRQEFDKANEDVKFSAAVAEFGMLLRDSKFKGNSNYAEILSLAKASKGKDEEGYRAEFIRLVEMAELLKGK